MAGHSDKLRENQAMVLLYLADELPSSERRQFERRLQMDAALAAQLDEVRNAQDLFRDAMGWLDASTPVAVPEHAAVGNVSRFIRQWTVDRLARPVLVAKPKKLPIPAWAYPLAAAAVIVIATTLSVVHHEHRLDTAIVTQGGGQLGADNDATQPATADTVADAQPSDGPTELLDSMDSEPAPDSSIDAAEQAVAAIASSDEHDNIFLGLGMSDSDSRGATP